MDIQYLSNDLKNGCESKVEIENLCRFHASELILPSDIDPWAFLVAISGCETSFGSNNVPRFEFGYSKSSLAYKRSQLLQEGYAHWGDLCANSYGPHQILWIVARELGYPLAMNPNQLTRGVVSIPYVVEHLNGFKKYNASKKEDFAACYNAGPGILKNKDPDAYPKRYVQKFLGFYSDLTDTCSQ